MSAGFWRGQPPWSVRPHVGRPWISILMARWRVPAPSSANVQIVLELTKNGAGIERGLSRDFLTFNCTYKSGHLLSKKARQRPRSERGRAGRVVRVRRVGRVGWAGWPCPLGWAGLAVSYVFRRVGRVGWAGWPRQRYWAGLAVSYVSGVSAVSAGLGW